MVSCSKENPVRIWEVVGLSVSPPEVAAWMKKRFGQVGPGREECQKLKTANSAASVESTGNWSDWKQPMTRFSSPLKSTAWKALAMKPVVGAGSVGRLAIGGRSGAVPAIGP